MDRDKLSELAEISKISLTEEETASFCGELDRMLSMMESVCRCEELQEQGRTPCTAQGLRADKKREPLKDETFKNIKGRELGVPRTVEQ